MTNLNDIGQDDFQPPHYRIDLIFAGTAVRLGVNVDYGYWYAWFGQYKTEADSLGKVIDRVWAISKGKEKNWVWYPEHP